MRNLGNPIVKSIITNITKQKYFENLDMIARSYRLPKPHTSSTLDEVIFEDLKSVVSELEVFSKWYSRFVKKENFSRGRVERVFCCWIAALAVSIPQEMESSTSFVGKTSRTYSFGVDVGNLTDRHNEWLTTAYKLMGSRPITSLRVRSLGGC